eukprot:3692318-Rhodomonas_salina.2
MDGRAAKRTRGTTARGRLLGAKSGDPGADLLSGSWFCHGKVMRLWSGGRDYPYCSLSTASHP